MFPLPCCGRPPAASGAARTSMNPSPSSLLHWMRICGWKLMPLRSFSRLFGLLAHPFAHEVDMISQHVEHARVGDWHSEVVCLLLQAVEPCDHLAHVAPAAAGVYQFVLQEPQLSVHAQNFRSHRPVIETRQKSDHRVEQAQDRN